MTTFAVVVTNYNYRAFVEAAVDSALAQRYAPRQIVVVDDGSTDGSTALLQERYGDDPRVLLLTGPNGGQLAAFQRGIAAATGGVACFLDADDRWAPDYLAKVGAVYDARADVDCVFTDTRLFGDDQRLLAYADRPLDLGYTIISTYMTGHWYGAPTSAITMRTAWARRCLDLPEHFRPTWRISADNCLVFGASVLGARKYFLPTGSVGYRIHGNNGWFSKRNPSSDYLNKIRSQGLIRYYGQLVGLDADCVELAKYEFRTKPEPTMREARRYAGLVMLRRASWLKNLNRAIAIVGRVWRNRANAPVEHSTP